MARIRKKSAEPPSTPKAGWRIGAYIRLSREDGAEESLSVVNQRKILEESIARLFDGEAYTVVDYFIDDGKTGTDYDRPAFQQLMGCIEAGDVNCVVCKTLARAFRNYADQGYFLEDFFPRHGTRFISIGSPQVDTFANPEAMSGMEVPITGLMNDRYAAKTSEDVRRTFNTKRRRGEFIGAFAPYGYRKAPENKNAFVPDEEAAQVVQDIFHWYVHDGLSKHGIAQRLNGLGMPNPSAYKKSKALPYTHPRGHSNDGLWGPKTIRDILANRMYLGHMVQGKQRVVSYKVHDRMTVPESQWFVKENTHTPLISQDLFDRAQSLSARDMRTHNGGHAVHLFSGYVYCADCHRAMQRTSSKGRSYFICRTYKEKSKEKCTRHSIRESSLEQIVTAVVRAQLPLVAEWARLLEDVDAAPLPHAQAQRLDAALQSRCQEQVKVQTAIASLYMDWKNGDITRADYQNMKAAFDARQRRLAQHIQALEAEKQRLADASAAALSPYRRLLKEQDLETLDRGLLTALVDRILIGENKQVTIRFQYADPFPILPAPPLRAENPDSP